MEHKNIAYTIEDLKYLLAHSKHGGSIYISDDVLKKIRALDGKSLERLNDELLFRFVKLKKLREDND